MAGKRQPDIPRERLERNPLISPAGYRRLQAILTHPDAPQWNYEVGDRVIEEDLAAAAETAKRIQTRRCAGTGAPPDGILDWVDRRRNTVQLFQLHLPEGFDLRRDWAHIPTMCRNDIALRLEEVVPLDVDLTRMIVYDTSGITGHAIQVPHHPRAMAQNHPMMDFVLARHGIHLEYSAEVVACVNVGAQLNTVTFANVFAVWNQAGFAKVNLHPRIWTPEQARRFFRDQAPLFLTGDPVGFAEMIKWDINISPAAMLSTAVALSEATRRRIESVYGCPVIDTYATTETGPIAYSGPGNDGMNILPDDIYVEIVDREGYPAPEGTWGEICVTGGRNPYLPLLRYRTGDFAKMIWSDSGTSDCTPRLLDLEGRDPVSFTAEDGTLISTVDIGRVIRAWPFVQHEFVQHADLSCNLVIQPIPDCPVDTVAMQAALGRLFGRNIRLAIASVENLGMNNPGGKVIPFRSEAAR